MTLEWYPNPPVAPMSLVELENYLYLMTKLRDSKKEWRLPSRSELFNAFENNESGFFTAGFYWTNLKEMKAVYGKRVVEKEKFLCRLVKEISEN
jgi:hypothetical protein